MAKEQVLQITKGKNLSNPKEEVAKMAYQYYVDRGYQDGYDQEDWLKAEATIGNQKKR